MIDLLDEEGALQEDLRVHHLSTIIILSFDNNIFYRSNTTYTTNITESSNLYHYFFSL